MKHQLILLIGYFKEVNREYTARRNYMVEALNKIPGVYCPKPKGAFYTVVNFRLMMLTSLHNGFLKILNIIIRPLWLHLPRAFIQHPAQVRMRYVLHMYSKSMILKMQ